jgi:hypothetical protein
MGVDDEVKMTVPMVVRYVHNDKKEKRNTTDAEQFDWDSDDGDYGLAIGRLVVT